MVTEEGGQTDRQTDRRMQVNFIICPMVCYSNGTDNNNNNIIYDDDDDNNNIDDDDDDSCGRTAYS